MLVFTQLFSKVARSDARQTVAKTQFNAKYPFKVIQAHAFWDPWKANDGLRIAIMPYL